MSHSEVCLPLETYFEYLNTAEGITTREMEVIAFLLYDRKEDIPKCLNLDKRGVNAHIYNITQKIKNRVPYGKSQNRIVKYIESLEQASLIKGEYYQQLGIRVKFEELLLKEIPKNKDNLSCIIAYWPTEEKKGGLAKQLKVHFDLLKFRTRLVRVDSRKSIADAIAEWSNENFDYFIFIVSPSYLKEFVNSQTSLSGISSFIFLSLEKQSLGIAGGQQKNITHINLQNNYYSFFVEVLKHLLVLSHLLMRFL